jgi:bifunctional non-homologous end joining protein LigD
MSGVPGRLPSDEVGWRYQIGFGGTRVIVRVEGGRIRITDADGEDRTEAYPELRGLGPALGSTQALLDGEIDGQGLWVGDLLHLDGRDITPMPFDERQRRLARVRLNGPHWRPAPTYPGEGAAVLAAAKAQGLPTVWAKRADSPYRPGRRSKDWREVSTGAAPPAGKSDPPRPSGAGRASRSREKSSMIVEAAGRRVKLSNPDKVLYPLTGFRKRDVLAHYLRVADVMLPHLADRPTTLVRWPDGVDAPSFFEKNVSRHAPSWLRTVRVSTPGSGRGSDFADFPMIDDEAGLAWAANLAALELHVPQWTVGPRGARHEPDLLVFDLDPGEGVSIVDCCRVAERLVERLAEDGLTGYPRTSGGKGMQLYVPVSVSRSERTSEYAKAIAEELAAENTRRVVAVMTKARRRGRVFIDWSQNNPAKTTIASYSLRGRQRPTVATPVTWEEVRACRRPEDLTFTAPELPGRIDRHGDLMAPLLTDHQRLPR